MVVFSSLAAAIQAGFRWYAFSRSERLHIVELDRAGSNGHRVKALAFAVPTDEEMEAQMAHPAEQPRLEPMSV